MESSGLDEEVKCRRVSVIATSNKVKSDKDHRTWQRDAGWEDDHDEVNNGERAPIVD